MVKSIASVQTPQEDQPVPVGRVDLRAELLGEITEDDEPLDHFRGAEAHVEPQLRFAGDELAELGRVVPIEVDDELGQIRTPQPPEFLQRPVDKRGWTEP